MLFVRELGQRRVEVELLEVHAREVGDGLQRLVDRGCRQRGPTGAHRGRLLGVRRDDGLHDEEHADVVGRASGVGGGLAHRVAVGSHPFGGRCQGEHDVGVLAGEGLPSAGGAGLHHDGLLGQRCVGEGSANLEEAAVVVDGVHLAEVGEHPAGDILDDRVGLPRPPELAHDVDPLIGTVVAQVVLDLLVEAVVLRGEVAAARHDIEAEAPVGEMLQRRQQARGGERFVEARRERRNDAELRRGAEQVGHERQRIVLGHEAGAGEVDLGGSAVGVGNRHAVLDDEQVETGCLEDACGVLVDLRLLPVVADAVAVVAPPLHSEAGPQEPSEVQQAHVYSPLLR